MAGRLELGFLKTGGGAKSLKEQLARTTLKNVRSKGHPYVELREDGKSFVFFCTLCLSPCYSDKVLFDHLKGSLHTDRLSTAKLTLFKENPWPFSDGVHFIDVSTENESRLLIKNDNKSQSSDANDLAIVNYAGNGKLTENAGCDKVANDNGVPCDLLIQGVLIKDDITILKARFVGFGEIAARFIEKEGDSNDIVRIWCEWLGENAPPDENKGKGKGKGKVLDHEFAVVTFAYNYDLGRKGLLDDVKLLLSSSSGKENDIGEGSSRKRRKSFSDPEDVSESLSNQYDSSGEDSSTSVGGGPSNMLLDQRDDFHSRIISSKSVRRELRRQHRIAAERMCDICQQKILPEKDVAALINMKTGKLACSSRNSYGQFHVFHTSCLIHWILLSEYEMNGNQSVGLKGRRKSRRKNGTKSAKVESVKALSSQIASVFCPECQGTGVKLENDERELPKIPLSEMFKHKIKISDGRRGWMKSPEVLKNCSIGFHFPSQSQSKETVQEKVSPLKRLHFYRADD